MNTVTSLTVDFSMSRYRLVLNGGDPNAVAIVFYADTASGKRQLENDLLENLKRIGEPEVPEPAYPSYGWYEAAGADSEYADKDTTYERWEFADECPNCGSRETHIDCEEGS